jgi:hypothetical protein
MAAMLDVTIPAHAAAARSTSAAVGVTSDRDLLGVGLMISEQIRILGEIQAQLAEMRDSL